MRLTTAWLARELGRYAWYAETEDDLVCVRWLLGQWQQQRRMQVTWW